MYPVRNNCFIFPVVILEENPLFPISPTLRKKATSVNVEKVSQANGKLKIAWKNGRGFSKKQIMSFPRYMLDLLLIDFPFLPPPKIAQCK